MPPTPDPPMPDEPGARLVSFGGAPPMRAGSPPMMLELLWPDGGRVCRPVPGGGARFSFTLPRMGQEELIDGE